jgi:cytoskeletal protein RodZ
MRNRGGWVGGESGRERKGVERARARERARQGKKMTSTYTLVRMKHRTMHKFASASPQTNSKATAQKSDTDHTRDHSPSTSLSSRTERGREKDPHKHTHTKARIAPCLSHLYVTRKRTAQQQWEGKDVSEFHVTVEGNPIPHPSSTHKSNAQVRTIVEHITSIVRPLIDTPGC